MNAFASIDIMIPEMYKEYFHTYCLTRTDGSKNTPEDSPFPRMVDMWFLALCIAIEKGLAPVENNEGKTYKAIEGSVLGSDSWRSNALVLLAIAHTESIEIVEKPHEMMRIANAYALAGLPVLIDSLENRGGDTALDHLSDNIVDYINAV